MNTLPILPAVLCLIFSMFEEIQVRYMELTLKASPLEQAPLDIALWIDGPFAPYSKILLFAARIVRWAFLIVMGYMTVWWYPIVLLLVTIPIALLVVTMTHLLVGLRLPSLLGYIAMPLLAVFMFIAL
jgi:hypothetical protein